MLDGIFALYWWLQSDVLTGQELDMNSQTSPRKSRRVPEWVAPGLPQAVIRGVY